MVRIYLDPSSGSSGCFPVYTITDLASYLYPDLDGDAHTYSYFYSHTAGRHSHADINFYRDADGDPHTNAYIDPHTDCDCDRDVNCDVDCNVDRHPHANSHFYRHADGDPVTDPHGDVDRHTDSDAHDRSCCAARCAHRFAATAAGIYRDRIIVVGGAWGDAIPCRVG